MEYRLIVHLKRLGKKKIDVEQCVFSRLPGSLRELIAACVHMEVERYNVRRAETALAAFLSPGNIEEQGRSGKVGFGNIFNKEQCTHLSQAVDLAEQSFQDGLFAVFVNGEEVTELDQQLQISQETVITFVRLRFLAGMR